MLISSLRLLALYVFIVLICYTHAIIDFDNQPPPKGQFQLSLDVDLAKRSSGIIGSQQNVNVRSTPQIFFSSYIEFKDEASVAAITDGQLYKMVWDAYEEWSQWLDDVQDQEMYDAMPKTLVGLAVGNHIIFASSQRGGASFALQTPDTPVALLLKECWMEFPPEKDPGSRLPPRVPKNNRPGHHNYEYRCGEIMAAYMWFRLNPTKIINSGAPGAADQVVQRDMEDLKMMKGRIMAVTWNLDSKRQNWVEPCIPPGKETRGNTWGCNRFLKKTQLVGLGKKTKIQEYDVADWLKTKTVVKVDHLSLCA